MVIVGPDQIIELPTNTASVSGSATDDGLPAGSSLTYTWTKVAGPGTVTFATPGAASTTATFSAIGIYLLRLTAKRFTAERQRRPAHHGTSTQQSSFGQCRTEPDDLPACEYNHLERRRLQMTACLQAEH